jgi:hypothetical protein
MKIDYQDLFYKLIIKYENLKIEDKLIKEELRKYKNKLKKVNK